MKKPLFSIILEDNSVFLGGEDYFNTKWKEIPNKKIKRIFYLLPTGDYFCLSGYDQYYHYVEVIKDLNGPKSGQTQFQHACLMGRKEDKVVSYQIDLKNKTKLEYQVYNIQDEAITRLNASAWK